MTVKWSIWDEDTRECLLKDGTFWQADMVLRKESEAPAPVIAEAMSRANDGSGMAMVWGGFTILAEDE